MFAQLFSLSSQQRRQSKSIATSSAKNITVFSTLLLATLTAFTTGCQVGYDEYRGTLVCADDADNLQAIFYLDADSSRGYLGFSDNLDFAFAMLPFEDAKLNGGDVTFDTTVGGVQTITLVSDGANNLSGPMTFGAAGTCTISVDLVAVGAAPAAAAVNAAVILPR